MVNSFSKSTSPSQDLCLRQIHLSYLKMNYSEMNPAVVACGKRGGQLTDFTLRRWIESHLGRLYLLCTCSMFIWSLLSQTCVINNIVESAPKFIFLLFTFWSILMLFGLSSIQISSPYSSSNSRSKLLN